MSSDKNKSIENTNVFLLCFSVLLYGHVVVVSMLNVGLELIYTMFANIHQ